MKNVPYLITYTISENSKQDGNLTNGAILPPEYIPPPPPPPSLNEEALLNDNYRQNEDNKFTGKRNQ